MDMAKMDFTVRMALEEHTENSQKPLHFYCLL